MLKKNENIVFGKIDGVSNDKPYMFPDLKVPNRVNVPGAAKGTK